MKAKAPPAPESTAELLRSLIAASGKSNYELWKVSGVSQSQIGRFMKDERSLTIDVSDKLFRALGYSWPPSADQLQTAAISPEPESK